MMARRRSGKGRGPGDGPEEREGPGAPEGQDPGTLLPLMDAGQVTEEPVVTEASSQGRDGQEQETGQSGLGNGSLEEGRGLELVGQEMVVHSATTRTPAPRRSEDVGPRNWNPWASSADPGQGRGDLQRWSGGPQGEPEVYGPLFTREQLEYLERWDRPGGLVNLSSAAAVQEPTLRRPEFLEREEATPQAGPDGGARHPRRHDQVQEYLLMEIQRLRAENDRLRKGNQSEETYVTPDVEVEKRGQARGPDPGHRDGEPEERRRDRSQEPSEELIKDEQTTDGNAQLNIILKLMEGMQQIQKKIMNGGNNHTGEEENAEVVKSAVELPMLPELSADTGPIDLQDWLTMVGPVMADLSDTSQEWWELMLKYTKKWYDKYMTEPPLQRLLLTPTPPSEVCNGRWRRVERRAVTLLMKALPDQVKEELIATKSLDVFSLICRLMLLYQPGGVAERSAILKNLEQPQEATSIQVAVQGIRRWLRWRRRAEEIGVSLPDPSVLNRGLQRLTKKVLENNKDLNFKISLARSTLQVDTVPNYSTIGTYCEHLLSELEQLVHTEKKVARATDADSKVKKFEGAGAGYGYGGGKGGESRAPRKEGEARERKPCRYYLTDVGCRRGRQCTFAHDAKDDKNRCYECGATDHYRKDCTRKQQEKTPGNKMDKSPGKIAKVSEVEDEENNRQEGDQEETSSASTATLKGSAKNAKDGNEGDGLQSVLEEAGKMLRSLNIKASAATDRREREDRMNDLQKQLDQMRKMRALRFAKVSKIDYQHEYGLLDSGATHSMRGACPGDDVENLEKIQVELAGGEKKELLMTTGKVIIHEDRDVQPIVPLGLLIEKMGCEVTWTKKGACRLRHPTMGEIPVQTNAGCPEVEKGVALALIDALEELEEGRDAKLNRIKEEDRVVELIRSERAFNGVPGEVMEKVVVAPAKDLSGLPLNRSRRRKLQEGFVVHLYAGEEEGYTLSRALKEVGGDKTRLVEIDLKRGADHDMMKDEVYAALMGAAFNGLVLGVVGGPNCRTRSVLRHYPLPAGKPRPVRGVAPEHWFGLPGLDEEEKRQVWEDDVLMYRMIMLYCAAEEGRKNRGLRGAAKTEVAFLLEQPDVPQYMPDCGSWWRTGNFRDLRDQHGLVEYSFRQGDYGGVAVKPTRVVTNLQLSMPATRSTTATTREESAVRSSATLSRWAPGMKEVARALQEVFGRPEDVQAELARTSATRAYSLSPGLPSLSGSISKGEETLSRSTIPRRRC